MYSEEASSTQQLLSDPGDISSIDSASPTPPPPPQEDINPPITPTNNNQDIPSDDDDDDYIISDDNDDEIDLMLTRSQDLPNPHLPFTGSLLDHATYFTNTLSHALDSVEIDKSLALEAQISGNINNENQKIIDKKNLLIEKLQGLQKMCLESFGDGNNDKQTTSSGSKLTKIEQMKHDIVDIENRIERLKHGKRGSSFKLPLFKNISTSKSIGVVGKYPIEYNQAKDKVLERQIDE